MANNWERAVAILRGVKDRINDLEENVGEQEGVPNILRFIDEKTNVNTVVNVVDSDRSKKEQTDISDSSSVSEGTPSNFTWADHSTQTGDKWGFQEWNDH